MYERLIGVAQMVRVGLQTPQLDADTVQLQRQVIDLRIDVSSRFSSIMSGSQRK